MKTRHEHVEECKKAARRYYAKTGDLRETMTAFLCDLAKHPETENHPAMEIMIGMYMLGNLDTEREMFKFIDGFN